MRSRRAPIRIGNLDQVLLTSSQEKVIQLAVSGVPIMGRKARGARVMRLESGERVTTGYRLPRSVWPPFACGGASGTRSVRRLFVGCVSRSSGLLE
jgi:hypothetical protein